jgi:hypothetical protein
VPRGVNNCLIENLFAVLRLMVKCVHTKKRGSAYWPIKINQRLRIEADTTLTRAC